MFINLIHIIIYYYNTFYYNLRYNYCYRCSQTSEETIEIYSQIPYMNFYLAIDSHFNKSHRAYICNYILPLTLETVYQNYPTRGIPGPYNYYIAPGGRAKQRLLQDMQKCASCKPLIMTRPARVWITRKRVRRYSWMELPEVEYPAWRRECYTLTCAHRGRNRERERESRTYRLPVCPRQNKPQPAYGVRSGRVMKYSNTIFATHIRGVSLHAASTRQLWMQRVAKGIASHLD